MTSHPFSALTQSSFVRHVEYYPQLDSTNNQARRIAAGEEPLGGQRHSSLESLRRWIPCLILADRQSAGRGRGTNQWWTGPGSLAMSLLLPRVDDWPEVFSPYAADFQSQLYSSGLERNRTKLLPTGQEGSWGLIGLGAALGVVHTVGPRLAGVELGVHWPNDVFAAGKKLAGILVEVLSTGVVVVGIGLNTNNTAQQAPAELRLRIATLRDLTGQLHPHEILLPQLLAHLAEKFFACVDCPDRLAWEADQWCLQKGRVLKVQTSGGIVSGICEGIGPQGQLLLRTSGGTRGIFSGSLLE